MVQKRVQKRFGIIIVSIISMLLALGLAACGGSDEPAPAPTTAAAVAPASSETASIGEPSISSEEALAKYAMDHAGGPGAIFVGDVSQLVGPATVAGLGGADGDVPLRRAWVELASVRRQRRASPGPDYGRCCRSSLL